MFFGACTPLLASLGLLCVSECGSIVWHSRKVGLPQTRPGLAFGDMREKFAQELAVVATIRKEEECESLSVRGEQHVTNLHCMRACSFGVVVLLDELVSCIRHIYRNSSRHRGAQITQPLGPVGRVMAE